jgi:hypothetical protein
VTGYFHVAANLKQPNLLKRHINGVTMIFVITGFERRKAAL